MKKSIFLAICLIVFVLLPAALAAPVPEQETKQLMSQYTDVLQKVESGIDYRAFCRLRQELSMSTQKFKEKYPKEEVTEDFVYLNQLYADIEEIWQLKAEQRVQFLPKNNEQGKERGTSKYFIHTVMLKMNYPIILDTSLQSKENGYLVNSVLDNLFHFATRETKVVKDKLEKGPVR